MIYVITGASGFIGKRLTRQLLSRPDAKVYFLIRNATPERLEPLRAFWGVDESRAAAFISRMYSTPSASSAPASSTATPARRAPRARHSAVCWQRFTGL